VISKGANNGEVRNSMRRIVVRLPEARDLPIHHRTMKQIDIAAIEAEPRPGRALHDEMTALLPDCRFRRRTNVVVLPAHCG